MIYVRQKKNRKIVHGLSLYFNEKIIRIIIVNNYPDWAEEGHTEDDNTKHFFDIFFFFFLLFQGGRCLKSVGKNCHLLPLTLPIHIHALEERAEPIDFFFKETNLWWCEWNRIRNTYANHMQIFPLKCAPLRLTFFFQNMFSLCTSMR